MSRERVALPSGRARRARHGPSTITNTVITNKMENA
jgi:hypothetical protein